MQDAFETLAVPDGWEVTANGLSRDGLHALDVPVGLNADGLIVVAGNAIADPDDWPGSYADYVRYSLLGVVDFTSAQGQLLSELIGELDGMRPSLDLYAAWLEYLKAEGRRPALRGAVDGGSFILDIAADLPAVWGDGKRVLHAEGEPFMLVGPQGVGKTTLVGQYVLRRVGLRDPELLELAVKADERPVIYLALDRPRQIAKSFQRMIKPDERDELNRRMKVWAGPLPFDLLRERERYLLDWLRKTFGEFSTVIVDSYKDTAPSLSNEEAGARLNAASQVVVAEGYEWVGLHHQRKGTSENKTPNTLADVYGSTWLTAGAGSVALLWGEAGDETVALKHLKQPAEVVGPLTLMHDHATGSTKVVASASNGKVDHGGKVVQLFLQRGGVGTMLDLATMQDAIGLSDETLRQTLKPLVERGVLDYAKGGGRGNPSTWTLLPDQP